jgi:hypothetical protein
MDQPLNQRQRILSRKSALWNERSSWITHWREISDYQQPRAGRFVVTDRNRGDKRANHILDNTAVFGARTLAAGLMSGVTSPARPWFRLEIKDKDLMESGPVKTWLHDTATLLRSIFATSNTYRSLHTMYEELGLFGTGASIVLPDFDNVVHHYPLTIGEYALATNSKGEVDTLVREFQLTVAQMVEQFGKENCSATVRNLWDRANYDAWVDVIHIVEPRKERDLKKRDAKNMPVVSCYMEAAGEDDDHHVPAIALQRCVDQQPLGEEAAGRRQAHQRDAGQREGEQRHRQAARDARHIGHRIASGGVDQHTHCRKHRRLGQPVRHHLHAAGVQGRAAGAEEGKDQEQVAELGHGGPGDELL